MTVGYAIRSGGYWLDSIAPYGGVETTWRCSQEGGGLAQVEWQMDLPYDFDHPALRRGARVELMDGAERIGQADLGEPGRTDVGRSFLATGIYRQAERFACLDADGETTTIPDVAIDRAHAKGSALKRSGVVYSTAVVTGSVTEGLNTLATLLTVLGGEVGRYWTVNADGVIRFPAMPTVPTWHLVPGVADPGTADDEYASALIGRYRTSGGNVTAIREDTQATARWDYAEAPVDLTPLGNITAGRAQSVLAGLLASGRSRLTFTDRLEVDSNQLLTAGGRPAPLSMVRAGDLVRAYGLEAYSQWLNGKPWLDFVIGEATWANGSDVISIAPVGLAPRTWEDLLAATAKPKLKP